MFEKIKKLVIRYYDVLAYLFFGVLTTLVNYAVYLPCYNLLSWSASISNVVAWIVAVSFAYLTNKPFVFKSHDWSWAIVWPELTKFIGCRIGSGLLETGIIFVFVDLMHFDGNILKLITSVLVVILNYFASKFLVFRKKTSG